MTFDWFYPHWATPFISDHHPTILLPVIICRHSPNFLLRVLTWHDVSIIHHLETSPGSLWHYSTISLVKLTYVECVNSEIFIWGGREGGEEGPYGSFSRLGWRWRLVCYKCPATVLRIYLQFLLGSGKVNIELLGTAGLQDLTLLEHWGQWQWQSTTAVLTCE